MANHISKDDEAPSQTKARELSIGDGVLFNDRKRPLTIVGTHGRTNS
jgi:hypothetical protein